MKAKKEPGMYGDGGGLYLRVGPSGSKSWILRTRIKGRFTQSGKPLRWEGGLGSVNDVSLADARLKAQELRALARQGQDPGAARDHEEITFRKAAERVHAEMKPTWKSERHANIWWSSMENHVFPAFGDRLIEDIGQPDVRSALALIWTSKPDTARRVKQRVANVFSWAIAAGHYSNANPVNRDLVSGLPKVRRRTKHRPALPWQELPDFMDDLSKREGMSAFTLKFLILTACRSWEVRGAEWSEFSGSIWTVPPERMKRDIPHRVPLSNEALAVVEELKGLDDRYVFPAITRDEAGKAKPQSVNVFGSLLDRMKVEGVTAHGFRSTFRDWASEYARVDREVAEAALSHATGNEVERAYARSDLFLRRVELMEQWGKFATGQDDGKVVRLAGT
ncbi:DUF4102 domain-containing protein [Histidinibacterium aquaticum]|uniref:DUF4102 domain-containing protein n=1 Tax=Histidinibacterium aquaticum TaxID=2613962 RepID=A0A5J5GP66_9RHOB|nr:DUF4102 domain-containing protein [Histidinibacterium aquaticum]